MKSLKIALFPLFVAGTSFSMVPMSNLVIPDYKNLNIGGDISELSRLEQELKAKYLASELAVAGGNVEELMKSAQEQEKQENYRQAFDLYIRAACIAKDKIFERRTPIFKAYELIEWEFRILQIPVLSVPVLIPFG